MLSDGDKYAPYIKWFGAAFAALKGAPELGLPFERVLASGSWKEREQYLSEAYEAVAEMYDLLGVTPPWKASSLPSTAVPTSSSTPSGLSLP
ncbi:MAG: hypothetical protein M3151_07280 [Actinomycetota bacterium]|nr:hypothetical protein [Actinomycetota bacterium]